MMKTIFTIFITLLLGCQYESKNIDTGSVEKAKAQPTSEPCQAEQLSLIRSEIDETTQHENGQMYHQALSAHFDGPCGGWAAYTLARGYQRLYMLGIDVEKAALYFKISADKSYKFAYAELGELHRKRKIASANVNQAIAWYDRAILVEDPRGHVGKALILIDQKHNNWQQKAYQLLLEGHYYGSQEAAYFIGLGHVQGWWPESGKKAARYLWDEAAKEGNRNAARGLSILLSEDEDFPNAITESDLWRLVCAGLFDEHCQRKAARWLLMAEEEEKVEVAKYFLDYAFHKGEPHATGYLIGIAAGYFGHQADCNKVTDLLSKSDDSIITDTFMARMMIDGRCVDQDIVKGLEMLYQASKAGSLDGARYLADLLEQGQVVSKDLRLAAAWRDYAEQLGRTAPPAKPTALME